MRSMVEAVLERILQHHGSLEDQPTHDLAGAEDVAQSLVEDLPTVDEPLEHLLDLLFHRAIPKSFNAAHPGYLAYIPGGGLFHAALADLLSDSVNRYVGIRAAAPALVQLEANVLRWFCTMVGYGPGSGGILTSGGSLANLTALIAARVHCLPEDFLKGTLYTSGQTHHSVAKAAALAGFPARNLRTLEVDHRQRLRLDRVREQVQRDREAGLQPFLLAVNAGTTNTGAVDDLADAADLAAEEGLWLHVDGAYGGFFMLTERGRRALQGLNRADSITLDPHKGLGLPYGTGCLLVKEQALLQRAHRTQAEYLPDTDGSRVDFSELSPELTRPFRGLRVWLPLKLHGVGAFQQHLDEKLDLTQVALEGLRTMPGVEITAEPQLSVLAFRLVKPGLDLEALNALNRTFLDRINADQHIYLSPTLLKGAFVLRIALLSFRTHRHHLEAGLEDIRRAAKALMDEAPQGHSGA